MRLEGNLQTSYFREKRNAGDSTPVNSIPDAIVTAPAYASKIVTTITEFINEYHLREYLSSVWNLKKEYFKRSWPTVADNLPKQIAQR